MGAARWCLELRVRRDLRSGVEKGLARAASMACLGAVSGRLGWRRHCGAHGLWGAARGKNIMLTTGAPVSFMSTMDRKSRLWQMVAEWPCVEPVIFLGSGLSGAIQGQGLKLQGTGEPQSPTLPGEGGCPPALALPGLVFL